MMRDPAHGRAVQSVTRDCSIDLARRGIRTEAIVLTGSVTEPNVRKNGILGLVESDYLGRAYAYCSGKDLPLRIARMLFAWPYSDLGRRGWQDVPGRFSDRFVTRWYPLRPQRILFRREPTDTFARLCEDLSLDPP